MPDIPGNADAQYREALEEDRHRSGQKKGEDGDQGHRYDGRRDSGVQPHSRHDVEAGGVDEINPERQFGKPRGESRSEEGDIEIFGQENNPYTGGDGRGADRAEKKEIPLIPRQDFQ